MATFEEIGSHEEDNMEYRKFPLRRMEPAIQKFLAVVQIDLGRIDSHKLNIERYNRLHDWSSLHVEQINATRTLHQLQSNLREIEICRTQVEEGDLEGFDGKIEPVKTTALQSLAEFLPLCNKSGQGEIEEGLIHTQRNERSADIEVEQSSDALDEVSLERPEDIEVAQSSDALDEDKRKTLDRVEDNVESAQNDEPEGVKHHS
ncbi:syntaxin-17-like [Mya arenaria]|uniref:syntaxin-17-like n=1 Tax=Mya arenaria TaxID=6604 RepID=UPI0022E81454|nr:syntaxin-17-like [Mya arenaria]